MITHVETTTATEPDCQTLATIREALAEQELLPAEHLVDSGYIGDNKTRLQHLATPTALNISLLAN